MFKKSYLIFLAVLTCSSTFPAGCKRKGDDVSQKQIQAVETYRKKHEAFVKSGKEKPVELLFIGDSLTEYWLHEGRDVWDAEYSKWSSLNFGISGDTTSGVMYRLANGELDNVRPRVIVLLIGTNDLSNGISPDAIGQNIQSILSEIKRKTPETTVILLGLFPRGELGAPVRQSIIEVNDRLKQFDNGGSVRFLDLGKAFLKADGTLPLAVMPDTLHLSENGYRIWADGMRPLLDECMSKAKGE